MDHELLAAADWIEITPSASDVKDGKVLLWGYAKGTDKVRACEIKSRLFARVLVLASGPRRTAIVSLDCAFSHERAFYPFPGAEARLSSTVPQGAHAKWAAALGANEMSVFVCPSHTHYAPAIESETVQRIAEKIHALRTQKLEPVAAKLGVGASPLCRFRRPNLEPVDTPPVDSTVSALVLARKASGAPPLACLVSYGVHPTLFGDPDRVTGDFVGVAMRLLEDRGRGISLFLQGFSGDLSPVYPTNRPRNDHKAVEEFAGYLRGDVEKALDAAKPVAGSLLVTDEEVIPSASVRLPLRPGYDHPISLTVSGLRLGNVVVLCCSSEVFFGYGPKIRERARARGFAHAILGGLVNGYSGYLPTRAAFHDGLGGYEMNMTPYTDAIEDTFLGAADRILDRLKNAG